VSYWACLYLLSAGADPQEVAAESHYFNPRKLDQFLQVAYDA
jgi:hypothetical protein